MLNNISSSYITKIIFSYLGTEQTLKIVKYNKILQNKLDIHIIDYRLFSGKYIIYESEKYVKEYFTYNDNLMYEGEYLNGKRNGKGKEYDEYSGNLKFLGEYLDGKRNGACKEYYKKGELKFEGEYLSGKKWNGKVYDPSNYNIYLLTNGEGLIKEYDNLKKLIFEGEYKNGERNGKGKEYNYQK